MPALKMIKLCRTLIISIKYLIFNTENITICFICAIYRVVADSKNGAAKRGVSKFVYSSFLYSSIVKLSVVSSDSTLFIFFLSLSLVR